MTEKELDAPRKRLLSLLQRRMVYLPGCQELQRPKTRGDCICGPRPCPWVSCKHHLYLEIRGNKVHINHRGLEPWEIPFTCALDVADFVIPPGFVIYAKGRDSNVSLEIVGVALGITRERVRQIEQRALLRLIPEAADLYHMLHE